MTHTSIHVPPCLGRGGHNIKTTSSCVILDQLDIYKLLLRMLGYAFGSITTNSHFGTVMPNFGMDDVSCTGNEVDIRDCQHITWHNCGSYEGLGAICFGDSSTVGEWKLKPWDLSQ